MSETPVPEPSDDKAKDALREQLAKLDLAPDQTSDDIAPRSPRDQELWDNVPPHHG